MNTNTLPVTTPAHTAGVVDVTVAGAVGSDVLPQSFTYLPPPTLTLVSPSQGGVTGGAQVTIQGLDLSVLGDVSVTFGGSSATVVSCSMT